MSLDDLCYVILAKDDRIPKNGTKEAVYSNCKTGVKKYDISLKERIFEEALESSYHTMKIKSDEKSGQQ